jgi:hypothetical protein
MESSTEKKLKHLKPIRKNGGNVVKVFEKVSEQVKNGDKPNVSGAMREVGYSESSSKCLKVTRTTTWQQLLDASIPDNSLMNVLRDLISPDNEDKRSRLDATKEALKLKNYYPAEKKNINLVKAELEDLFISDEGDRREETFRED